jgi:hypothetical protein
LFPIKSKMIKNMKFLKDNGKGESKKVLKHWSKYETVRTLMAFIRCLYGAYISLHQHMGKKLLMNFKMMVMLRKNYL